MAEIVQNDLVSFDLLAYLSDKWNAPYKGLLLCLFTDPALVPADDDQAARYTAHEANFPGYQRQALGPWSTPLEDEVLAVFKITAPAVQFCATATVPPVVVYGVFALEESTGYLQWACREWPAGITFANPCDCATVQPTYTQEAVTPGD